MTTIDGKEICKGLKVIDDDGDEGIIQEEHDEKVTVMLTDGTLRMYDPFDLESVEV